MIELYVNRYSSVVRAHDNMWLVYVYHEVECMSDTCARYSRSEIGHRTNGGVLVI